MLKSEVYRSPLSVVFRFALNKCILKQNYICEFIVNFKTITHVAVDNQGYCFALFAGNSIKYDLIKPGGSYP